MLYNIYELNTVQYRHEIFNIQIEKNLGHQRKNENRLLKKQQQVNWYNWE